MPKRSGTVTDQPFEAVDALSKYGKLAGANSISKKLT
jgi:hypothetical protein